MSLGRAPLLSLLLAACSGGSTTRTIATEAPPATTLRDGPAFAPLDLTDMDAVAPLDPRITTGTLANGLTYYVLPHAQPARRAYLWLVVNAGSVQEDDDQRGLAHFVEHMAFNGTERYAVHEIIDYLESIGMAFGADVNASTSWDETMYKLVVPTDDFAFVDTGLDILHEWAGAITFAPEEVDKERGVVREEWRLDRGVGARVYDKQAATMFAGTRYAERLPIGELKIIEGAPRDALVRYYEDWYRPDLMAVVAVGDFDGAAVEQAIQRHFADLAAPPAPRPRPGGSVPPATGTRVSIVTDPEASDESVTIYNQLAHRRESTVGDYRRTVGDGLYNSMLNERLDDLLDEPDAPMTFAGSSTSDLTRDIDAFSRSGQVKRGQMKAAVQLLFTEVLRVEQHGFTAGELARAKRRLLREIEQDARERDKRDGIEHVEEITRLFLQKEQMPGREREAEMIAAFLPTFTLAELNGLAKEWGGSENRVILVEGPARMKKVTEANVLAWIAEVERAQLAPWTDDVADRQLLPTPPAPGKVTGETTIAAIGVTEWTLSNGAKVVVKPTDFAIDEVHLDGFSPGGTSLAPDATLDSALNASAIVAQSGLGDLTAAQVDKLLSGVVVDVDTYVGELSERVRAQASAQDLETMFQLLYLKFTAPRRDETAFAAWKAQSLEWVRGWNFDPDRGFFDDLTRFVTKNHPRRRSPNAKRIAKVKLDDALAFYADRFADAGDFTFVIVGNVDLAALRPLVERYVASLPSTGREETWKDLGITYIDGVRTRTVHRGREPKAYVRLFFHADDTWSRDAELDAGVLADALDMRLFDLLREQMGGVYGVDVDGGIARRPVGRHTFAISFGCAPEAVKPLTAATLAELRRIETDGVDASILAKLREQRVRAHELNLRDNGYWLGNLSEAYEYGDDPTAFVDLAPELARLTNANLEAAAKRFLATDQYVTAVRLPRAK
jgi:zinc protease